MQLEIISELVAAFANIINPIYVSIVCVSESIISKYKPSITLKRSKTGCVLVS